VSVSSLLGIAAVLVIAAFGGALVRRPPIAPLRLPLLLVVASGVAWSTGEVLTGWATRVETKWPALVLLYAGSLSLPPLWWLAMVRWARAHGLDRPRLGRVAEWAPITVMAGFWLLMVTHPWHGSFVTPVPGGRNVYHAGFYAAAFTNYGVTLASAALCLWTGMRLPDRDVRRASLVLVVPPLAIMAANLFYVFSAGYFPLYYTGLVLAGAGALALGAVLRTRRLWRLPATLPEILRHDPNGVILADEAGRVFFANPAARALLSDLALTPELDIFAQLAPRLRLEDQSRPLGDRDRLERLLFEAGAGGRGFVFRGRAFWVGASRVPERSGRTAGNVLRLVDMTDLRRMQRERRALQAHVQEAEQLRGFASLAGGIAHDFNNSLTGVLGNASLALEEVDPASRLADMLRDIEGAALEVSRLTQQLLVAAGRAPVSAESLDLSVVAFLAANALEAALPEGATLRTALARNLPYVRGDADQLRQVISRLVSNAVEAIEDEGGWVTIRTGVREIATAAEGVWFSRPLAPGSYVFLEVSDSGRGMDAETRRRMFEPFFSTRPNARGLGLSVAAGLVHAHGGALEVSSEPGRGTAVSALLPAPTAGDGGETGREDTSSQTAAAWRGDGRVLLVDDEALVRRVARGTLERLGFEVIEARTGREALELFGRHGESLRCVVLDLTLPDLPGAEVLQALRHIDPRVRVVLSSGYDASEALRGTALQKLTAFVAKPYRACDLTAAVRRLLADGGERPETPRGA